MICIDSVYNVCAGEWPWVGIRSQLIVNTSVRSPVVRSRRVYNVCAGEWPWVAIRTVSC